MTDICFVSFAAFQKNEKYGVLILTLIMSLRKDLLWLIVLQRMHQPLQTK